ncbi:MAG: thymidine phosphorylase [Candidatus Levybacteria bacterium]|nr:thymidine phosphorylase [Candidatus Levybacteria bacterium]
MSNEQALKAIQKKLVGKKLSYKEIYSIMDEIANDRLGDVLTTYFAASGYSKGFSYDEIYFLTKAMVETGEKLKFEGIVADKHSIGGLPGTRATMVIVPIVASAGFLIPKSSSRAITTPAGTADSMETIAKVTFDEKQIYEIVRKTNACIVWGGSFKIAPADDEIIHVEEPLALESFDKILVSVMAKKVAFGSNHVVIDIPYGKTMKVHHKEDAEGLARKFKYLARRFDIKLETVLSFAKEPAGNGIGPLLEAVDALKVLEQEESRPLPLEEKSLLLASELLKLCLPDADEKIKEEAKLYESTLAWATDILVSGRAHKKMMEIVEAQQGDPTVRSNRLHAGPKTTEVPSDKSGKILHINSHNVSIIAKVLGAPQDRRAGLFLHKRVDDTVSNKEVLFQMYSETDHRLSEAVDSLEMFPIYDIE